MMTSNLRRSTRKRGNSEVSGDDNAGEEQHIVANVEPGNNAEPPTTTSATAAAATAEAEGGDANKRIKLEEGNNNVVNDPAPTPQPQQARPTVAAAAVGHAPKLSQPIKSEPLPQQLQQQQQQQPAKPAVAAAAAPQPAPLSAGAAAMAASKPSAPVAQNSGLQQSQAVAATTTTPALASSSTASTAVAPKPKQPQSATATATITHAPKPPVAAATATSTTTTNGKTKPAATLPAPPPQAPQPTHRKTASPPPPLKSLTFHHLQKKYSPELDYMLIEFRKLEKQLLGAPNNPSNPKPEAAGSKERREKLHGFILHLDDTIRQITEGCVLEEEELKRKDENVKKQQQQLLDEKNKASMQQQQQQQGNPSSSSTSTGNNTKPQSAALPTENFTAAEASLSHLTPAKEKEESVQRLEEHILANLLPVKIRLTRQLAAQKGATRNPATAPVQPGRPGGSAVAVGVGGPGVAPTVAAPVGKGSFAAAAEAKRKAQEKMILLQQEKQRQREVILQQRNNAAAGAGGAGAVGVGGNRTAPSQYGRPIGQARSSLTSRLHGRVLGGGVDPPPPTHAASAAAAATATRTTMTTGTVADPTAASSSTANPTTTTTTPTNPKRRILYAGMAPGSTQVPSSVNAVSGVHPGLIGADAARAVTLAEDERKRLKQLEESAARVALGVSGGGGVGVVGVPKPGVAVAAAAATPTTALANKGHLPEGPATMAARARAVVLPPGVAVGSNKLPRPNQPLPTTTNNINNSVKPSLVSSNIATLTAQQLLAQRSKQSSAMAQQPQHATAQHHPTPAAAAAAPPAPPPIKVKPKKPHTPLDYNNPSLSPNQQFDLRLQEARWRQRKRRRERRRQRSTSCSTSGGVGSNGHHFAHAHQYHHHGGGRMATMTQQQAQAFHHHQQQQQQHQQQRLVAAATARLKAGDKSPTFGGIPGTTTAAGGGISLAGISHVAAATTAQHNQTNNIGTTPSSATNPTATTSTNTTANGGYGPRQVEYVCAMCNECYPSTCELNPWWALECNSECPKCGKAQIPRLDITAPTNVMEYHPSLLAHLDGGDMGGGGGGGDKIGGGIGIGESSFAHHSAGAPGTAPLPTATTTAGMGMLPYHQQAGTTVTTQNGVTYITRPAPSSMHHHQYPSNSNVVQPRKIPSFSDSDVSHTDESDGEGGGDNGGVNYDESSSDEEETDKNKKKKKEASSRVNDDGDEEDTVTREEQMDKEEFGFDYKGEKLSDDQARKLLVLIEHASTCPGRHQSAKHRNVCHSTKYLMLHVRDCTGLISNGDICPFPWCRKVKHLLYHLVSCEKDTATNNDSGGGSSSNNCTICCPTKQQLSPNLSALMGLNTHRRNKFKERVKAVLAKRQQMAKAAAAAATAAALKAKSASSAHPVVGRMAQQQHTKMIPAQLRTNALVAAPPVAKLAAAAPPVARLAVAAPPVAKLASSPPVRLQQPIIAAPPPAPVITPRPLVHPTAVGVQKQQQQHLHKAIPNPASAAVAASLSATTAPSTTTAPAPAATPSYSHQPQQLPSPSLLPSPALSATGLTDGLPSTLSVSALPTLEEAAFDIGEIGDISLSTSDLMGPASASTSTTHTITTHTTHNTPAATSTIVVKSETTTTQST